jgi:drug/metabolite transporter (DMT)-like permease
MMVRSGGEATVAGTQTQQSQDGRTSSAMVWAALASVYVIWGSTYLAIRVGIETLPPLLMASVRFLVAGGIMYAVAIRMGDRVGDRPTRQHWKSAAIIGTLLLLGGNGLVTLAEETIPSGATSLFIATVPLWLVLMARVAFKERIGMRETAGIVIGFGGLVLLAGLPGGEDLDPLGVTLLVIAPILWAIGSLYSRRAVLPKRPLVGTGMEMLLGGVACGVVAIAKGELGDVDPSTFSAASLMALAYLIVFGSLVAFTAYVWLLRNARTSLVATYAYVNPVVAVFLGWLILDEPMTSAKVIAGAVIVTGVALIVSAQQRNRLAEKVERRRRPWARWQVAVAVLGSGLALGIGLVLQNGLGVAVVAGWFAALALLGWRFGYDSRDGRDWALSRAPSADT